MTETQWLLCASPTELLLHLRRRKRPATPPRRYRLFGCACARHAGHLWTEDLRYQTIIEAVERFCDEGESSILQNARGRVIELQNTFGGLESTTSWATNSSWRIGMLLDRLRPQERSRFLAVIAVRALTTVPRTWADGKLCGKLARWVSDYSGSALSWTAGVRDYQVSVIRDIIGNPFRPALAFEAAWLKWNDATIPRLAQRMYDTRDFASMPILADALEEAGCTSADLLGHCRGPGPHVRGCWVVDLVLGKE